MKNKSVGTNSNRFGTYASRRVEELAAQHYPGEGWYSEALDWGHAIGLILSVYLDGHQHRHAVKFGFVPPSGKISLVEKKIAELGSMEAVLEWFAREASDKLMGWAKTMREKHASTPDAGQQQQEDRADPGKHDQR